MAYLKVLPKKFDYLDANDDDCIFRINIDVLNEAFGVGRSMYARGSYPDKKNTYFSGSNPNDRFYIWMPKLYGNGSEWINTISADGTVIYEKAEPTRSIDWTEYHHDLIDAYRIVFVKPSVKEPYKFVGVFQNGDMNHLDHAYRRIATKIELIGNPVYKIDLLDDNR